LHFDLFFFLLGVHVNLPRSKGRRRKRNKCCVEPSQQKEGSNMSGHCELFQGNAACLSLTITRSALENQKSGSMGFMRKANKLSPKKHT